MSWRTALDELWLQILRSYRPGQRISWFLFKYNFQANLDMRPVSVCTSERFSRQCNRISLFQICSIAVWKQKKLSEAMFFQLLLRCHSNWLHYALHCGGPPVCGWRPVGFHPSWCSPEQQERWVSQCQPYRGHLPTNQYFSKNKWMKTLMTSGNPSQLSVAQKSADFPCGKDIKVQAPVVSSGIKEMEKQNRLSKSCQIKAFAEDFLFIRFVMRTPLQNIQIKQLRNKPQWHHSIVQNWDNQD